MHTLVGLCVNVVEYAESTSGRRRWRPSSADCMRRSSIRRYIYEGLSENRNLTSTLYIVYSGCRETPLRCSYSCRGKISSRLTCAQARRKPDPSLRYAMWLLWLLLCFTDRFVVWEGRLKQLRLTFVTIQVILNVNTRHPMAPWTIRCGQYPVI